MASTTKARAGARPAWKRGLPIGWLIGPTMLLATVCGLLLVQRGLERTFAWALAALLGAAIVWMLVSVLWPARPDRTCASCGRPALRRRDLRSTKGVSCGECGYEDASASSFLLAEEDAGSIEPIVLAERTAGVERSRGPERSGGNARSGGDRRAS